MNVNSLLSKKGENAMLNRIQQLCLENKTTITKLERECGLANATIRRWGTASPSADNLAKVADHFGVSVDYLLGRGVYSLSASAQQYAKQFDALPDDKKQLAMAYMGVVQAQ